MCVHSFLQHGYAQTKISFSSATEERKLSFAEISYTAEADTIITFQKALNVYRQGKFTVNTNRDLNLGIANDNYWVAFELTNETTLTQAMNVVLGNPRLNEVHVTVLHNDTLVSEYTLGDNFSFDERPLRYNEFSFPLELPQGKSTFVLLYIKHKGNTLQMPITLLSTNAYLGYIEYEYLFTGIVSGIFLITFFFGIFFLFNTRDLLFLYYSLYIITALAWVWTTEGFAFQYLWPSFPELATRLGPGLSAVSACFFVANTLQFCKPYDETSRYRKIIIGILIFLVIWSSTPFIPFIPITEGTMAVYLFVYFSMNVVIAALLVSYLLWLSFKGNKIVLYYFGAVMVTIICALSIVLRGGGVINIPFSSSTVMSLGYVLEIILMTAGITKQFYNYRKEKEETLMAYLDQQKSITGKILQTQEVERLRIGRELHDDIGAGLTSISLMSEMIRSQGEVNSQQRKELNDIAVIARNLVNSMGEIVWALNPENKSLEQLMIYLREQLTRLLEYSGINYSVQLPAGDSSVSLNNVQLRNTMLIAKELVNNAIKYSQAKTISVLCVRSANELVFEISDDGIGMDVNTIKRGNGLNNIQRRAAELGGRLEIHSQPGAGTTGKFSVPL